MGVGVCVCVLSRRQTVSLINRSWQDGNLPTTNLQQKGLKSSLDFVKVPWVGVHGLKRPPYIPNNMCFDETKRKVDHKFICQTFGKDKRGQTVITFMTKNHHTWSVESFNHATYMYRVLRDKGQTLHKGHSRSLNFTREKIKAWSDFHQIWYSYVSWWDKAKSQSQVFLSEV